MRISRASRVTILGTRQKEAILLDSVDLVQARNCQVRLTHALECRIVPTALVAVDQVSQRVLS